MLKPIPFDTTPISFFYQKGVSCETPKNPNALFTSLKCGCWFCQGHWVQALRSLLQIYDRSPSKCIIFKHHWHAIWLWLKIRALQGPQNWLYQVFQLISFGVAPRCWEGLEEMRRMWDRRCAFYQSYRLEIDLAHGPVELVGCVTKVMTRFMSSTLFISL